MLNQPTFIIHSQYYMFPISHPPISSTLVKTESDLAADGDDVDYETEHDSRKRACAASDPIHTTDLRAFLQQQISSLAAQVGASKYGEIIENLDVETAASLREYVALS